jgi:hypothetical protein
VTIVVALEFGARCRPQLRFLDMSSAGDVKRCVAGHRCSYP